MYYSKPFPQILPKSYRHNAVPNRFSSRFSTSRTNGPRSLSLPKAGIIHTRSSEKDRTQRLTRRNRGLPSLDHSAALCRQRNTLYSATLLYTYISRFSVNPHHQQREKIRQSYRHGSISSRFSTSPTNGPRSLSRAKAGTHSAFGERSHTAAHTAKHGAFRMGVVSLLSERSARSQTSPGRVSAQQTLPLLGLGRVYSRRTQRAFGTAMRLCASLSRGVAAPLGCVICLQLGDVAVFSLCAQYFLNVRGMGGITTLGVLCVLLKRRTAACQSGSFAVF